jgi:hypothetical protein
MEAMLTEATDIVDHSRIEHGTKICYCPWCGSEFSDYRMSASGRLQPPNPSENHIIE